MCKGFAKDVTNQNLGKKGWSRDRSRLIGTVQQRKV